MASSPILALIADYFSSRGWQARVVGGGIEALKSVDQKIAAPNRRIQPNTFLARLRATAFLRDFVARSPLSVINPSGVPLFTTAGLARLLLDPGGAVGSPKLFVLQPCIRTQSFDSISEEHVCLSSFVNVCTEWAGATPENHVQTLDGWLCALSAIGIYVGRLRVCILDSPWVKSGFVGWKTHVYLGNVHIGDAIYIETNPVAPELGPISDIGFGFERLLFAACGTTTYSSSVLPPYSVDQFGFEYADAVRSLTLMSAAGVRSGSSGAGYYYRVLLRRLLKRGDAISVPSGIRHSYDWWLSFASFDNSVASVQQAIAQDLEDLWSLEILRDAGLRSPNVSKGLDREEHFWKVLARRGASDHYG